MSTLSVNTRRTDLIFTVMWISETLSTVYPGPLGSLRELHLPYYEGSISQIYRREKLDLHTSKEYLKKKKNETLKLIKKKGSVPLLSVLSSSSFHPSIYFLPV